MVWVMAVPQGYEFKLRKHWLTQSPGSVHIKEGIHPQSKILQMISWFISPGKLCQMIKDMGEI